MKSVGTITFGRNLSGIGSIVDYFKHVTVSSGHIFKQYDYFIGPGDDITCICGASHTVSEADIRQKPHDTTCEMCYTVYSITETHN